MPSADVLALTGNEPYYRWNISVPLGTPLVVTYSFPDSQASYDTTPRPGFAALSATQRSYAAQALATWGAASGISFVEVPASVGGQIRIGLYDMSGVLNSSGNQASGFAYFPNYTTYTTGGQTTYLTRFDGIGGDIFLNANFYLGNDFALSPGQRGYSILLHEIGHAIGFKHPFEGTPTITPSHDNGSYTILSYNRPNSTTALGTVDVEASQFFYGNSDYSVSWNAATLTLSIVASSAGEWVLGTELSDQISAGAGVDTVIGQRGNDRIDGGSGADFMLGGVGNDTYLVDDTFDLVDEGAIFPAFAGSPFDFDQIYSSADWFWDVYSTAEHLELAANAAGSGGAGSTLVGSVFSNAMVGNAGTNILFGRGGSDTYRAGDGIDYISLSTLGLTDANSYVGVNGVDTVVVDPRSTGALSYDAIFEFESGKDEIDVSAYDYATGAEVLALGQNDGLGNSYYALGDGLDFVYVVGLTTAQLQAGDFLV